MLVIIAIVVSILLILGIFSLFLPLALTVFIVLTAVSFTAFHWTQNPASASRALAHVQSLIASAPKFWLQRREDSASGGGTTVSRLVFSPLIGAKLTNSIKARGKENIENYVRPTLKPRRFGYSLENNIVSSQGQSPQPWQPWAPAPLKNSTAANLQSPRISGGINLSTGFGTDEKLSYSRLPLSPIYPPNKSVDSPELDISSTMLRFNSGQDSLLHPSMHYPTHQPDMVASPALLPSVSWLKDGGLSSPRQRRGLPRVQSPVMVKIASPLPDRPASPLFRKLATESGKRKSSSNTDKVIMAIKQRQKRPAQESNAESGHGTPTAHADVRSDSKRRRLDSASSGDTMTPDIDMDLNPLPKCTQRNRVFTPSRFGITSPTPRNPIVSSFSSSKRSQGTLKRRKDSDSVEVEEEEGVSPIKKKIPPQPTQPTPDGRSPSAKNSTDYPAAKTTPAGVSSPFSPLRAGSRALFLEKRTATPSETAGGETNGTLSKSRLKGKVFTPQRASFVQRVDTPGEYTAADSKEDRAQARQRGSYLKEMLIQESEKQTSQGDVSTSTTTSSALFTTTAANPSSTSASKPSFSLGPLSTTSSTTSATSVATSATAATSAPTMPVLSNLTSTAQKTMDNPLLSSSDKLKLLATNSEKTVSFGGTTPQLNLSASASATAIGLSQKGGEATSGFKLPTATSATITPGSSATTSTLHFQGVQKSVTFGANPLGSSLGGASLGTQIDAKGQSLSANNATATGLGLKPQVNAQTPSAPLSGGFRLGNSSATPVAASSASATTSSSKPQFKPIFSGPGGSAAPASQPQNSTVTSLSGQAPSVAQPGGFQFGQNLGGSTPSGTSGRVLFGNTQATSSTIPSGLATPFQAGGATSTATATPNKQVFSMSAPSTAATAATPSGGNQYPFILGQFTSAQTPAATGLGQTGGISSTFGALKQVTSQAKPGGFAFPAPSESFSFGGNTGAAAATTPSTTSSTTSVFGSSTQPRAPFGASKPATNGGLSIFGGSGTAGTPNQAPMGSSTNSAGTMFGAGTTQQAPAFGAGGSSIFGAAGTPSTQSSVFGGGTSANRPTMGNPTATVTPFGSATSQPASGVGSPFQFGTPQPKTSAPPAQSGAPGGFQFGAQTTPQVSFNFGATATPNSGMQFGQTTAQPSAGSTQQQNFFSGGAAATINQFGAGDGFGSSAQSSGATPAPAFGLSPSPAAAPGGGGFSIGTGGSNTASSQKRANRLRQVRSRAGRR